MAQVIGAKLDLVAIFFVPAGTAMMPALHMRILRRDSHSRKFWAQDLTEERSARSHFRNVVGTFGAMDRISEMTRLADFSFRPVK